MDFLQRIPPAGWIGLCFIVVLIVSSYLMLWTAWKQRNTTSTAVQNTPPSERFTLRFHRPWQEEDKQLAELAQRVAELKNNQSADQGSNDSAPPKSG